jgi:hypothetical protein
MHSLYVLIAICAVCFFVGEPSSSAEWTDEEEWDASPFNKEGMNYKE